MAAAVLKRLHSAKRWWKDFHRWPPVNRSHSTATAEATAAEATTAAKKKWRLPKFRWLALGAVILGFGGEWCRDEYDSYQHKQRMKENKQKEKIEREKVKLERLAAEEKEKKDKEREERRAKERKAAAAEEAERNRDKRSKLTVALDDIFDYEIVDPDEFKATVDALLKNGASLDVEKDPNGDTLLAKLYKRRDWQLLDLLRSLDSSGEMRIENSAINQTVMNCIVVGDNDGLEWLRLYAHWDPTKAVQNRIKVGNDGVRNWQNLSHVALAAHYGHLDTLNYLIEQKAPLDSEFGTLWAIPQGEWDRREWVTNNGPDTLVQIIDALLKAGADVGPEHFTEWMKDLQLLTLKAKAHIAFLLSKRMEEIRERNKKKKEQQQQCRCPCHGHDGWYGFLQSDRARI